MKTATRRCLAVGVATGALLAITPAQAQYAATAQAADSAQRAQGDAGMVDTTEPQGDDIVVVGTAGGEIGRAHV